MLKHSVTGGFRLINLISFRGNQLFADVYYYARRQFCRFDGSRFFIGIAYCFAKLVYLNFESFKFIARGIILLQRERNFGDILIIKNIGKKLLHARQPGTR